MGCNGTVGWLVQRADDVLTAGRGGGGGWIDKLIDMPAVLLPLDTPWMCCAAAATLCWQHCDSVVCCGVLWFA